MITTERPADTTTADIDTGRSFASTPDTLYGAPPIDITEPPQSLDSLYGAPPTDETKAHGYGAVPPGTLDTSYTAALPPPKPTTVEKV